LSTSLHTPLYRDPRRLLFAFVGLVCVALAGIGALVPGVPTTIFVLIAAWCFTRSCPWLEQRLLRNRFFARPMQIIDGERPFTKRARRIVIAVMWGWGLLSVAIFLASGLHWLASCVIIALLIGTIAILRFRSGPDAPTSSSSRPR